MTLSFLCGEGSGSWQCLLWRSSQAHFFVAALSGSDLFFREENAKLLRGLHIYHRSKEETACSRFVGCCDEWCSAGQGVLPLSVLAAALRGPLRLLSGYRERALPVIDEGSACAGAARWLLQVL